MILILFSPTCLLVSDDRALEHLLVQAMIFSVPFGGFSIETGFVNISLPNLFIIITVAYFGTTVVLQEGLRLSKAQGAVLGLFSIMIAMISVTLFVQQGSPRRLITYIGYWLITTILFLYIKSISDAERVLRVAFFSAVVISILTIVHALTYPVGLPFGQAYLGQRTVAGITIPFQRTLWLPIAYSGFGMMMMIGTPYYLYLGLKTRSATILAGTSLVLFAVLISQSRSTWAATGVAVFVVISGYIIKEYEVKASIAYLSGVIFPTIVSIPAIFEALVSIQSGSFLVRIEQYRVALSLLQSNPVVGIGLGNIGEFYSAYSIHSGFLRIGAEAGAIVLLMIVAVWAISALFVTRGMFWSSKRYVLGIGILASIGVMIIEANMAPGFGKAPWIVLAIGLGVNDAE